MHSLDVSPSLLGLRAQQVVSMSETAQTGISQKNNQTGRNRSPITGQPADGLFRTPGSDVGAHAAQRLPTPCFLTASPLPARRGSWREWGEAAESISGDAVPPRGDSAGLFAGCAFLQPSAEVSSQAGFVLLISRVKFTYIYNKTYTYKKAIFL